MRTTYPTPYPDVNAVLDMLMPAVQTILGDRFVGLYLHGSLALGDFNPNRSDIDFVVVTAGDLPNEMVLALAAMHERIAAGDARWGVELEGSYIPRRALRRYDPADARHPHIERGGKLRVEQHESDWVMQRHILREHGVALAGPALQTLIDPVRPDDLRQAVRGILWWWELQLTDTSRVEKSGYQAYAILTMCRIFYTLQHGAIVSKPLAARWAQEALDERWAGLIERALVWRNGESLDSLEETLDFIRYTLEHSQ
ncbi:MAG: DUF4111 domain-containing protein [Chloroflexi bacterium]|nr:DUF4111 domain-containing protein [Chloroflexota bacterium]MCI0580419.1 DUF4111 domain-containing protein [Chloroflexota bacterium]MCI0649166.1 DUF4111 domain-containing protein [Chloroflexota bacterium]MCI0725343.1 DUF4111 domain-containing protein [Chloroflexota bacterium]